MYDNYNNLYPQLIKDSKTLLVVKDFMKLVIFFLFHAKIIIMN